MSEFAPEPRFRSHNSVYHKEGAEAPTYSLSEIRDRYLPDLDEQGIVAADMDGTMFRNDLGTLVFLEKLSQSPEWPLDPEEFAALLTPSTYQTILDLAKANELTNIEPEKADFYEKLRDDCIDLYVAIYKEEKEELTIQHPLVNEFARKMLELDTLGIEMEQVFMAGHRGQILSRTRFFVGTNPAKLNKLTKAAMISHQNGSRFADLQVYPKNERVAKQRIGPEDLKLLRYDKKVVVIDDVRYLIDQLFNQGKGAPVRVVTTNLGAIARGALEHSCYADLLEQDCDGKSPVLASKLERNAYGKMAAHFRKLPIFGQTKAKVLRELEEKINRRTLVAVADSVTNDAAMGGLTLNNGGIFFIVGKYGEVFEQTRARFKSVIDGEDGFRRQFGDANIGDRIFYAQDRD